MRFGVLDINGNKRYYDENANKKCQLCGYKEENEIHVFLSCPSYAMFREKYVYKHWPNTEELQLKEILNNSNEDKNKDLAMFLFYSMKRREYLLNG